MSRKWARHRIEILNHALRNIPPEKIRHHTCYGINIGPRVSDFEMKYLADLIVTIRAKYYSFEMANARHEHEWQIWETVKLPDDKVLLPGCITQASVLVEHPELVAQRITRLAKIVGRERVIASADCGFASTLYTDKPPEIEPEIVWAKFESPGRGRASCQQGIVGLISFGQVPSAGKKPGMDGEIADGERYRAEKGHHPDGDRGERQLPIFCFVYHGTLRSR